MLTHSCPTRRSSYLIAMSIWIRHVEYFFCLPAPGEGPFYLKTWHLLQSLPQLHPATALLALGSLALALFGPRIPGLARVPGPLLAMLAAPAVVVMFDLRGVATIESTFGEIPRGLPKLELPEMGFDRMLLLLPSAFPHSMPGASSEARRVGQT